MKRAVSISIDHRSEIKRFKLIYWEGCSNRADWYRRDMEKAAQMYRDLDGKVDVFGVGGADLGLLIETNGIRYTLFALWCIMLNIHLSGWGGLKITLERKAAQVLQSKITVIWNKKDGEF